jgi:hypothetical protein
MEQLAHYLDAVGQRRWRWGETDCLMMLADWVKLRTGADPAAEIRGTYATEEESLALIRCHRSLVGCIDRCVKPLGIQRTTNVVAGDIGVVFAGIKRRGQLKRGLTGAICVKPGSWAVKSPAGLLFADFKVLRAWGIETGRRIEHP